MAKADWSEKAKEDYWKNIDYLLDKFTQVEAINFIEKVESIITIIEKNPKIFQKSDYKNIHIVPIVPQVSLFYSVNTDDSVRLVRFWNNYQNPASFSS